MLLKQSMCSCSILKRFALTPKVTICCVLPKLADWWCQIFFFSEFSTEPLPAPIINISWAKRRRKTQLFSVAELKFPTSASLTTRAESLGFAGRYMPPADLQEGDDTHALPFSQQQQRLRELRLDMVRGEYFLFAYNSLALLSLLARWGQNLALHVGLILAIRKPLIYNKLQYSVGTFWHSLSDNNLSTRTCHSGIHHEWPAVTTFHHSPVIRPDWTFTSPWFIAFANLREK